MTSNDFTHWRAAMLNRVAVLETHRASFPADLVSTYVLVAGYWAGENNASAQDVSHARHKAWTYLDENFPTGTKPNTEYYLTRAFLTLCHPNGGDGEFQSDTTEVFDDMMSHAEAR